ncbi:hypothetical protein HG531_000819 [Fusarium graminearum]|nr:hypothetical protein HG531_000819 [Fusarium graminearum]
MKPKINQHAKRESSIQPRSTPFITKCKQGVGHNKQRLNGSDVAPVERTAQQLAHPLAIPPSRGTDIVWVLPNLEARAEL